LVGTIGAGTLVGTIGAGTIGAGTLVGTIGAGITGVGTIGVGIGIHHIIGAVMGIITTHIHQVMLF
jgi:hypothetical protein